MSTTPLDLFETAKRLNKLEALTEADFRAVISRAYYAALHCVDATFAGVVSKSSANSHEEVIAKAAVHGNSLLAGRTDAKLVAREMYKFKKLRKIADYSLAETLDEDDVGNALCSAEGVLERCSRIYVALQAAAE